MTSPTPIHTITQQRFVYAQHRVPTGRKPGNRADSREVSWRLVAAAVTDVLRHPIMFRINALSVARFVGPSLLCVSPRRAAGAAAAAAATFIPVSLSASLSLVVHLYHVSQTVRINDCPNNAACFHIYGTHCELVKGLKCLLYKWKQLKLYIIN